MFKKKFKKSVKNKFMRTKVEIENFKLLIVETIQFNNILYNRIIKKKLKIRVKNLKFTQKKVFAQNIFILKNYDILSKLF